MSLLGWLRTRFFPRELDHRDLHPEFVPACVDCQLARIKQRNEAAKGQSLADELRTIRARRSNSISAPDGFGSNSTIDGPNPTPTSDGLIGFENVFASSGSDFSSADPGISTDSFSGFDGGSSGGAGASGDF